MAVTTTGLTPNAVTSRLRTALTGTPGMLRAGLAACLVALVLFGTLAAKSAGDRRTALTDARSAAAQAVLVQQVHTSLVRADALATNAFLVGGLEPAALRDGYTAGIQTATETLATAAGNASGAALTDLEAANAALARYAGLIESARANNRQGFPVGVAYLRQASQLLLDDVLPRLDAVTVASQDQVDDAYDRSGSARWGLWLAGLLVLATLVACQLVLSRATRRTLNVGLVAATALALVAFAWGAASMSRAGSRAEDARSNEYRNAVALADARIAAFGAKSAESLGLINRGNATAFDERWQADHGVAVDALAGIDDDTRFDGVASIDEIGAALDDYAVVYANVRDLDDNGGWDAAVAVATGFDADQSNGAFQGFDDASSTRLDRYAAATDDALGDTSGPLGTARFAALLLTLLAAVATIWGFNLRMKEYR